MLRLLLIGFLLSSAIEGVAQITITGQVTDSKGQALVGVTVTEKGTINGTFTDASGRFSLRVVKLPVTLAFSYIGFATTEKFITSPEAVAVVLQEATTELTGIEVVGSRAMNRSITESLVPIDYIDVSRISDEQGQMDVNQLLHYLAPSFNANRQSGADGSDHIDPATLRGLGPDQTLVLINGKRRHQSSLINIYGTRGRGNTGTDLNAIPVSAIDHIEILRDGASAQYGSDAIAGVINVVLKRNTNEFTGNIGGSLNRAKYRFDDKTFDGPSLLLGANQGWDLGKNGGFVNVTTEYLFRGHTNRANTLDIFPNSPDVRNQFGQAQTSDFAVMVNSEVPVSDQATVYSFGGFNFRTTDAYAFTRSPESERNVLSIYPNGFDPIISSKITDRALTVGIKGMVGKWKADLSNTYGSNRFHFYGKNTVNASLEGASPTQFDDGGTFFAVNTSSLAFTRYFDHIIKGLNVAYGLDYRIENYQIFAGEEASWKTYGPVIFRIDSVFDEYGVFVGLDTIYRPGGAQGFPGFRPDNEVNQYRTNIAGYVDVEVRLTDALIASAAARMENYSDFGNTLNGKLALRYALGKALALRGSVSTGFRAPSLAQIYYNQIFTNVQSGVIFDALIANNVSPVTRALGIPALKEEKATNASLGLVLNPTGGLSATIDGYWVRVRDRIVLTGNFDNSDPVIGPILDELNVVAAQFFTNAVNTTNIGVDVIVNYARYWSDNRVNIALAGNFNQLTIDSIYTNELLAGKEDSYFGPREQQFLIYSAPPIKMNLTLGYGFRQWDAELRINHWGKVEFVDYSGNYYTWQPKQTIDLSLGYDLSRNIRLSLGAVNLTNVYPKATSETVDAETGYDPYETETGGAWDAVQMGFDGTLLFAKLGLRF
ncbi:MAG: TonB-dependent receptor [Chitinophagales bacterium]|nr:TonB-dependent receptor [Chitinophagales bacterium]MDW8427994.1 TonB-dependent receptor [Chitinophagales bacterium]